MIRPIPVMAGLGLSLGLFATLRQFTSEAVQARSLSRLEALTQALEETPRPSPAAPDPGLEKEMALLSRRLDELERAPRRNVVAPVEAPAPAQEGTPPRAGASATATEAGASRSQQAEFRALLAALDLTSSTLTSSEEMERFWELARGTSVVDEALDELEGVVDLDPGDLAARMELAELYLAKMFTVPSGPEMGLWNDKAEEQWSEIVDRDPHHWEAQFTLANNWSHYPDFLNKTNDAIRGLERAREIQEALPPRAEFVETYLSLARMQMRKALVDEARATLEHGLRLHPGDEGLLAALEDLP